MGMVTLELMMSMVTVMKVMVVKKEEL